MNFWGWEDLPVDPAKAETVDRELQVCMCNCSCEISFHQETSSTDNFACSSATLWTGLNVITLSSIECTP